MMVNVLRVDDHLVEAIDEPAAVVDVVASERPCVVPEKHERVPRAQGVLHDRMRDARNVGTDRRHDSKSASGPAAGEPSNAADDPRRERLAERPRHTVRLARWT